MATLWWRLTGSVTLFKIIPFSLYGNQNRHVTSSNGRVYSEPKGAAGWFRMILAHSARAGISAASAVMEL